MPIPIPGPERPEGRLGIPNGPEPPEPKGGHRENARQPTDDCLTESNRRTLGAHDTEPKNEAPDWRPLPSPEHHVIDQHEGDPLVRRQPTDGLFKPRVLLSPVQIRDGRL